MSVNVTDLVAWRHSCLDAGTNITAEVDAGSGTVTAQAPHGTAVQIRRMTNTGSSMDLGEPGLVLVLEHELDGDEPTA